MKKNKLKKIVLWFLVLNIAFFTVAVPCEQVSAGALQAEQDTWQVGGYIPDHFSEPYTGEMGEDTEFENLTKASLMPVYTTPRLPAIRNQNPFGTCWAFSSISLCEINLMNKGYDECDLSELHLIYYATHLEDDSLGGLEGDSIAVDDSYGYSFLQIGGNYEMAINALADGRGAVLEDVAPYDNAYEVSKDGLSSELAYESVVKLNSYISVPMIDTEAVKQAIVEYGAVGISYYDASLGATSNEYYNSSNAAYYCGEAMGTNHAVAIVGWDDTYPASNFSTKPEGDGAWLVRNSWGTWYGKEGYFYLSYYDKSISGYAVAFDVEPAGTAFNRYQYDGAMYYAYSSYFNNKAANVFTAHANDGGAEELSAVSFEIKLKDGAKSKYTVNVYKNLRDAANPESGTLVATVSGTAGYTGMYKVNLPEPVLLSEGEKFSVVVDHDNGTICTDCSTDGYYKSVTGAKAGQTFCYVYGSWLDYGESMSTNARIKAFTYNKDKISVTGIEFSHDYDAGELFYVGEKYSFPVKIMPENADDTRVKWSSSNPDVASVDENGNVTALAKGTTKITAISMDGGFSTEYTMNVIYNLDSMRIKYNADDTDETGMPVVEEGKNISFSVEYSPEKIELADINPVWSVSDHSIASIDSNGELTGLKAGTVTVFAYSELYDYKASISVTVTEHVYINGWVYENDEAYWYENDIRQGYSPENASYRGKEIYDPGSDAWYWLDNVQYGAKAVSKDVYQESEAGEWGDIHGDDGKTYGKWVHYDAEGHMVKGWQTTEAGTYYFDPVYGTMAKGAAIIAGSRYYFDMNTGILQEATDDNNESLYVDGWHVVDGVEYWYEGGERQGVKYNSDGSLDMSYRGKEIYDPDSDAWYWLDNVQYGAKTVSKDVYQDSVAGEWGERVGDDGLKYGKWVRYDENGHMVKGWQTTGSGTCYFDPIYGTMAKNEVIIDGVTHLFDADTGIMYR